MEGTGEGLLSDDGDETPRKGKTNIRSKSPNHDFYSDEEQELVSNAKKRLEVFSDSDSESERPKTPGTPNKNDINSISSCEADTTRYEIVNNLTRNPRKSRIKRISSSDESDRGNALDTEDNSHCTIKQSSRLNSKRINLRDKLQNLKKMRNINTGSQLKVTQIGSIEPPTPETSLDNNSDRKTSNESSENLINHKQKHFLDAAAPTQCVSGEYVRSDFDDSSSADEADELASIEKIKQKIKERSIVLKSTLLIDPDTSDEDIQKQNEPPKYTKKNYKESSPKPVRMSAKQAMENMHKIKSESNRMLREKDVSLPYHRPKALTLKDILSRRKTVLTPDGKALPLKMNDEQLKFYVHSLEERQKEMIELCKSDTEDEGVSDNEDNMKGKDVDNDKQDTTEQDNDASFDVIISNDKTLHDHTADELNDTSGNQDSVGQNDYSCDIGNCEESCDKVTPKAKNGIKSVDDNNALVTDIDNQDNSEVTCNQSDNQSHDTESVKNLTKNNNSCDTNQPNTELESQLISLHYSEYTNSEPQGITRTTVVVNDMEKTGPMKDISIEIAASPNSPANISEDGINPSVMNKEDLNEINNFSDDEINMEDIDRLIENADIIESSQNHQINSPMLIKDVLALTSKPKLVGAPGMVIDLDGSDAAQPRKLTGVELLKQRFTYFAQLKTPEEIERAREKQIQPGFQHLRLKHELEEKIAEQKSLEWAKRLEEEKQQHMEMDAIRGDDSGEEDDIDKMEAKLAETEENGIQEVSEASESEPEENDIDIKDKPRRSNPLLDEEAEESDAENDLGTEVSTATKINKGNGSEDLEEDDSGEETSDEDSSDENDEVETEVNPKKTRILKAFEDSDDENAPNVDEEDVSKPDTTGQDQAEIINMCAYENSNNSTLNSQDDEIQSAQLQKSISEDIFNTQPQSDSQKHDNVLVSVNKGVELNSIALDTNERINKLAVICETQPYDDSKFDEIAGMCSGSFSQNLVNTPRQAPSTEKSATQEIDDDVLALCTGKFYDNQLVSQSDVAKELVEASTSLGTNAKRVDESMGEDNVMKAILEELDGPEFEDPKPNKFFLANKTDSRIKELSVRTQQKKRFTIDSDDEAEPTEGQRAKKLKKKKLKDRALQISDDEDETSEEENADEFLSAEEEEEEGGADMLVEYDSEENEVAVPVPEARKKKRKVADFFEQEAELTSEDEWVGSGDEDEAGLDRMEREEGDSERFNQAALQRELGQIHMRDVLDQDKREVRLIQELLLEDGDLGGGSRQRKFRWRNADGEEETGTLPDDFADTQEEDFESEEQWRKQRHEREVFLRQLQQEGNEKESPNTSISRKTIIKANLVSKTMSSLLLEVNAPKDTTELPVVVPERKSAKDIPSPVKRPFNALQQHYRGSLLSRGTGALARLAAIAAPLAGDSSEDNPKIGSLPKGKNNFVFATLSPSSKEQPKVSKRKNDGSVGTPQLMKKLKADENRELPRMSLLEHLKT